MELTIDLTGRRVIVAGSPVAARRAVRRYRAAGALVLPLTSPTDFTPDLLEGTDLVAAVQDGQPGWSFLEEACRFHNVLLAHEAPAAAGGSVTLVGGGPGATGLLTLDGAAALREADVVLFDRLAPTTDLKELAPAAELIDVGKLPGHHRVSQQDIEALLTAQALAGRTVVRLKGGDPFVFGRGGEELTACIAARIPCRIIAGISSAVAVPAAAGIPVTHRGVSHLFTVVSGHAPLTDDEHTHLAGLGGTIVVLMGVNTLPQLVAGLRAAGMRADMLAAIIERGYSASQRTTSGSLGSILTDAGSARCQSPAVLVIGEVVRTGLELQGEATRLASLADSLVAL
ncbi:uroporphyrinogen-III C-methyltransferase [Arthrobacter sp. Br18]|uniref:uroporphyrinogen-III C-methyltransferase n=1 Tax=Arthrobacter sp. Br18 TaxID=1312954 RepID=UPI00047A3322|nr:uroporphyrinogen-III C-methyltransferase [Arthrobacter sp. Br18]